MTQILSAYMDVNNTASLVLWLTQPVLSFWLASLSYICRLLNITHQRRLKLGQQYSIWNMSINRAEHYTGKMSIKKQHLYSSLPRHSECISQHSGTADFASVCKISEEWCRGNTALALLGRFIGTLVEH